MSLQQKLEEVTGLTRVRLAELLYEHEGFVDHEGGFNAPDRDVPVWIERSLTDPHYGDCTKVAASCMTCHAQMALDQWDEFVAMLERAVRCNGLL